MKNLILVLALFIGISLITTGFPLTESSCLAMDPAKNEPTQRSSGSSMSDSGSSMGDSGSSSMNDSGSSTSNDASFGQHQSQQINQSSSISLMNPGSMFPLQPNFQQQLLQQQVFQQLIQRQVLQQQIRLQLQLQQRTFSLPTVPQGPLYNTTPFPFLAQPLLGQPIQYSSAVPPMQMQHSMPSSSSVIATSSTSAETSTSKKEKRKRSDATVDNQEFKSPSGTPLSHCPSISGKYSCSEGSHQNEFELEIASYDSSDFVRYKLRQTTKSKKGAIMKFDVEGSACKVLGPSSSSSSSSVQTAVSLRNDVLGEGIDLDQFIVAAGDPNTLTIRHSQSDFEDAEEQTELFTCTRSGSVGDDFVDPRNVAVDFTSFDMDKIKEIGAKDPVSAMRCLPASQERASLETVLKGWLSAGESEHQEILGMILKSFEEEKSLPLPKGLFSICDHEGKIVSVGILEKSEKQSLELKQLVTDPSRQRIGGARAAIQYALKESILNSKNGIHLTSLGSARTFYFQMGFVSSFDDLDDRDGWFDLDLTEMLQKFPEFMSSLKPDSIGKKAYRGRALKAQKADSDATSSCDTSPPILIPPSLDSLSSKVKDK